MTQIANYKIVIKSRATWGLKKRVISGGSNVAPHKKIIMKEETTFQIDQLLTREQVCQKLHISTSTDL